MKGVIASELSISRLHMCRERIKFICMARPAPDNQAMGGAAAERAAVSAVRDRAPSSRLPLPSSKVTISM